VHLVTLCSEFNAEFGRHHARTAVGGVTSDSDPHEFSKLPNLNNQKKNNNEEAES
jgi:hypothetical protein